LARHCFVLWVGGTCKGARHFLFSLAFLLPVLSWSGQFTWYNTGSGCVRVIIPQYRDCTEYSSCAAHTSIRQHLSSPPCVLTCCACLFLPDWITQIILGEEYKS
jgi:hypothetical protein